MIVAALEEVLINYNLNSLLDKWWKMKEGSCKWWKIVFSCHHNWRWQAESRAVQTKFNGNSIHLMIHSARLLLAKKIFLFSLSPSFPVSTVRECWCITLYNHNPFNRILQQNFIANTRVTLRATLLWMIFEIYSLCRLKRIFGALTCEWVWCTIDKKAWHFTEWDYLTTLFSL